MMTTHRVGTPEEQSPHTGQPLHGVGLPLSDAHAAMVLVHGLVPGRGASADWSTRPHWALVDEVDQRGFAYLAPQAAGGSWFPESFLAPLEDNEPWLSSALTAVGGAVDAAERAGIPADRILLVGFSQGACLTLEFVVRNPRRYGGVAAWSGGVMGPDGLDRPGQGDLAGTLVFLGCSDADPYSPQGRVDETEALCAAMGANVTKRIYPGLGHEVNQDEIEFVRRMMAGVLDFSE